MIIGNKAGLKKKSLKYIKINCNKKAEHEEEGRESNEVKNDLLHQDGSFNFYPEANCQETGKLALDGL